MRDPSEAARIIWERMCDAARREDRQAEHKALEWALLVIKGSPLQRNIRFNTPDREPSRERSG